MKTFGIMVLLALVFAGSITAQTTPDLKDPKIKLETLKTQVATQEKAALKTLGDTWIKLLQKKDADAAEAAKGYDAEGAEKSVVSAKITTLQTERDRIQRRLEIIRDALLAKDGKTEAGVIDAAITAATKDHLDFTDPSALLGKAKAWLTDPEGGIRIGINILMFFVILLAAKILSNIAAKILSKTLSTSKLKISDLLRDFFINTTRKLIFFGGLVMALGRIGIDTAPLLAGIGVMGFVIGFALQGTLSNFASGVMILLYRPYDIGNVVSAAGATGKVTAMSLVSTTLTTPDNQIVIIPNSSIWGGVITNITGNPTRRVDLTFGIGYDDDIPKAMSILKELATGHPLVLKSPEVVVQLHELADSSVNFVVRPWSKTGDYWAVYWDLHKAVKERFDAEGISIPYPQQDVHAHQVGGVASA